MGRVVKPRQGPPTGNLNTDEVQKFVETRSDDTAVRTVLTGEKPDVGEELPGFPFKPDPITMELFQRILCELSLIRQHMEIITGDKLKGD